MPAFYYVHVPRDSATNLQVGIDHGVWGWRSSALEQRRGAARAVARDMRLGDHLVLGFYGPNPRDSAESYLTGRVRRVVLTRVSTRLYGSSKRVWPDKKEIFPERVGLDVLDIHDDVAGVSLGREAMAALQRSANTRGVPVAGAPFPLEVLVLPDPQPGPDGAPDRDGPLDVDGDLDVYTWVVRRREQKRMRARKFGGRSTIVCDLCGRELPQRLVVAAHIKRRSDASYSERRDQYNIMAACLLGCDALFEHGHLRVDGQGLICQGRSGDGAVAEAVDKLVGRVCTAFTERSRAYFTAHSDRVLSVDTGAGQIVDWLSEHPARSGDPSTHHRIDREVATPIE